MIIVNFLFVCCATMALGGVSDDNGVYPGSFYSHPRPCPLNDTYCGEWVHNKWLPVGGWTYRNVSGEQARKCLGNRTLAFIGDSMTRDFAVAVALLLQDSYVSAEDLQKKFEKASLWKKFLPINEISTRIEDFENWKNVAGLQKNGNIFPKVSLALKKGWEWQVQNWYLFRRDYLSDNQAVDVLANRMPLKSPLLKPIDLAFWGHGLHDHGWWRKPPYVHTFFGQVIELFWLRARATTKTGSVWLSMNSNCKKKLPPLEWDQSEGIDRVNEYLNVELKKRSLPYFDIAEVLRCPQRCEASADGLHVKRYVDAMRAQILFNRICDEEFRWRGHESIFLN